MNRLALMLVLTLTISALTDAQCDFEYFRKKIADRIKKDNSNKDTSFYLFDLSTGNKTQKRKGDQFNDTTYFTFRKGCYLRFYLITKGLEQKQATLKLIHNLKSDGIKPGNVIKVIENENNDSEIKTFEYYLTETENLILTLNQIQNPTGCAFAVAIQYRQK